MNLSSHILTHTRKKPYKCIVCEVAIFLTNALKTHILTHTGERPYKCDNYEAMFT